MVQDLSVLADVVTRLERGGVPYSLTGSVATNSYVPRRTTVDIDIVVQLSRADAQRVVTLFEDDYYVDRGAVEEAISLHRSFNVIHYDRLVKIDFIVAAASALLTQRLARRRRQVVDGVSVWVLAPEDLILAKLEWARTSRSDRQLQDVRNLLAGVPDLDHEYLSRSARVLGLTAMLDEVRPA